MNVQRRIKPPSELRPVRWSIDDYFALAAHINAAFERTQLLDGWIYEMPTDGPLTRKWNRILTEWLVRNKGGGIALVNHQTLPLGGYWAPSPDHYLFPESVGDANVRGRDVLLVIEVSDTTLEYDLGGKADAYAEHGVAEYWVIDPNEKTTYVHRLNADGAYGEPTRHSGYDLVEAARIPGLKLRLADFPELN